MWTTYFCSAILLFCTSEQNFSGKNVLFNFEMLKATAGQVMPRLNGRKKTDLSTRIKLSFLWWRQEFEKWFSISIFPPNGTGYKYRKKCTIPSRCHNESSAQYFQEWKLMFCFTIFLQRFQHWNCNAKSNGKCWEELRSCWHFRGIEQNPHGIRTLRTPLLQGSPQYILE